MLERAKIVKMAVLIPMKKSPLLSVVIPVYNEEKYLSNCFISLKNQTYKNFEVIIVDDGSTDKSHKLIKKYNFIYLKQKHKGSGAARNLGASKAKGEILVFADADMAFDKNYLINLIKPILNENAIGTFTKDELVGNQNNIWSKCWSINNGLPVNRRIPQNYHETENVFRAITKKYFFKAGGFDINDGYTDDSTISKKLKIKAVSAKNAVCYHSNPSSLAEVYLSARWIGRGKIFNSSFKNLLRFSFLNSFRISLLYLLNGATFYIVPFKLVYDLGVLTGIFFKKGRTYK
ncbi:glycosyltransferase [Candidatus Microgenomates bacterium]|nr:MAG: glycosyltransferase [Candidatus Microgenomates bacterium]